MILYLKTTTYLKKINSQVFPGLQGGPLMHAIAAKAICFKEAMSDGFKDYQRQVVKNAAALAAELIKHGFRITSGGTDNNLMLVDVKTSKGVTGKKAEKALDLAGITINKKSKKVTVKATPNCGAGLKIKTTIVAKAPGEERAKWTRTWKAQRNSNVPCTLRGTG